MAGINETKEALVSLNELAIYFAKRFKDGINISDFLVFAKDLAMDGEFRRVITDGYKGAQNIPGEVKDLDLNEIVDLINLQTSYVPKLLEAIKK